jgi:hypothetical protein
MMSSTMFLKQLGGISSCIAGFLLLTAHLVNFISNTGGGTVLGSSLVLIAHILLVFAFIGLYLAQDMDRNIMGIFGLLFGVLGTILVSAVVYVELAGATGVNIEELVQSALPSVIKSVGSLLFVFGLVIFGLSFIKDKKSPVLGGWMLICGTIIFALGSVIEDIGPFITVIGAMVTGAGFIVSGIHYLAGIKVRMS